MKVRRKRKEERWLQKRTGKMEGSERLLLIPSSSDKGMFVFRKILGNKYTTHGYVFPHRFGNYAKLIFIKNRQESMR